LERKNTSRKGQEIRSDSLTTNLKDLPDQGFEVVFDNNNRSLKKHVSDLTNNEAVVGQLNISGAGNAYHISGHIKTAAPTICSRCADDIVVPVDTSFNEILVVEKARPRNGHNGHTGTDFESSTFCNYVNSYDFHWGDFIHEQIAAFMPFAPKCQDHTACQKRLDDLTAKTNAELARSDIEDSTKKNPFAALKSLKL
jgi:uncharacterized metal-binding protein YceD (DUF177 family)